MKIKKGLILGITGILMFSLTGTPKAATIPISNQLQNTKKELAKAKKQIKELKTQVNNLKLQLNRTPKWKELKGISLDGNDVNTSEFGMDKPLLYNNKIYIESSQIAKLASQSIYYDQNKSKIFINGTSEVEDITKTMITDGNYMRRTIDPNVIGSGYQSGAILLQGFMANGNLDDQFYKNYSYIIYKNNGKHNKLSFSVKQNNGFDIKLVVLADQTVSCTTVLNSSTDYSSIVANIEGAREITIKVITADGSYKTIKDLTYGNMLAQ